MADVKYLGLTTYLVATPDTNEKLTVLCEAIDVLQSVVTPVPVDRRNYESVLQSPDYHYLYDNDSVCYVREWDLPNNTPAAYQKPKLESVNVKGVDMLRLYIPTTSKNRQALQDFQNALRVVMLELFGGQALSMKALESIEYEEFTDGKESVLISTDKQHA